MSENKEDSVLHDRSNGGGLSTLLEFYGAEVGR